MASGMMTKPSGGVNTVLNVKNADTDIYIQAYANSSTCTVYITRETDGTAQTGWFDLATLPEGYRPKAILTAYFISGLKNVIRLRVMSSGIVRVYSPDTGQIGGVITFPI